MSAFPGERSDLICPDCGAPMHLVKFWRRPSYVCAGFPRCKGKHGATADGTPVGIPADAETRMLRLQCHTLFDTLWKHPYRLMSRGAAYRHLQQIMGMSEAEAHIGLFDADQCRELLRKLQEERDAATEIAQGAAPSGGREARYARGGVGRRHRR